MAELMYRAVSQEERLIDGVNKANDFQTSNERVHLWKSVKLWRKIVGFCIALSTVILLHGYDYGIVGTVTAMPEFQFTFGQKHGKLYIIPSLWLSLWSVASPLGSMAGSIIGGYVQEWRGRRTTIAIGSVIVALAVGVIYSSDLPPAIDSRRGTLFGGKLSQGVGIGIMLAAVQTYMSEVLPTSLRGPVLAFFPIFTLLGQLVGAGIVFACLGVHSAGSYRIAFASQWPFSLVALIAALLLPESPTWLLRRNRSDAALKAQQRLVTRDVSAQAILDELRVSLAEEETRTKRVSYLDCFKGIDRRRTGIVIFANILPELFGLSLLANASYFLETVGMGSTSSIALLILGIALGLISNTISPWVLNTVGRRMLILSSLGSSVGLWLLMGIVGCFKGAAVMWFVAVIMMVIIIICGVSVWPASYVVAAETSSLRLRGNTQGIGQFSGALATGLFSILLPYVYNVDEGDLRAKAGFVMAGFAMLGFCWSWFAVPEMKGRTPRQIDRMFDLGLPAREFGSWVSDVGLTKDISYKSPPGAA